MTESEDEALQRVISFDSDDNAVGSGDFFSKLIFGLCLILTLCALAASAYAFAGFAENDTGIMHLLSAFALCFGIGGLVFVPMGLIASYAKRAIRVPLSRLRAVVVILLVLPWIPFCYYLLALGELPKIAAIIGMISSLLVALWAARFLR